MSRLCVVTLLGVLGVLVGCAASDPTGGAFGEASPDGQFADDSIVRSRCPAGEMLTCELKSPNRVSDGRYGFRNGTQKRCSCQQEDTLRDLTRTNLPRDNR